MTLLTFPAPSTYTVLTGLCTLLEASDGSTRAAGGWALQATSAINPAAFTSGGKYTFSVTVDKGAGEVEVPLFAKGLGRYDNDKYRALYIEIAVDGTVPVYPAITAGNAAARGANVPATSTANGWVVRLKLTVPSTFAPLTRAVNNTGTPASMWEDMTAGVDGQCPLAWRQDVTKMGRTNAVVLCTDATYLSKCGAFPWMLTRAEEESAASYTGSTAATVAGWAATHNANFDRYVRDMWWNDVRSEVTTSFAPQAKFTNRVITNTAFRWSDGDQAGSLVDLTNTNRNGYGVTPDTTWGASQPPQYGVWRLVTGGATLSNANGLQPNYYDRAQLYFKKYRQTGDLEYYRRACAHAFAYRHWSRFDDELQDHVFGPTGQQIFCYQPQGIAEYHLLAGDPLSLTHIEAQADRVRVWADFGDSGVGSAEPRPMARTLHVQRWAYNITRPANAGYPEGNTAGVNGVASQDWSTALTAKVTKTQTGTGHVATGGVTFDGTNYLGLPVPGPQGQFWTDLNNGVSPGNNWREVAGSGPLLPTSQRLTETLEQVGMNPFMMPIMAEALWSTAHNNPAIGATLQANIIDDVDRVARFQYATLWEGTPADRPNVPVASQPCFVVAFNGTPHADQYAWYQCGSDLTMLYPQMFAWVAWQKASGEMRALAERIIANGILSAYYGGSKQAQEANVYMAECFAALSQAPAPSAITTYDAASQVVLSSTSGTLGVGGTVPLTATIRDLRRVKLLVTPVVTASHPTIASGAVTNTVDDATGRTTTVTVTGLSVGESTIWVTDPTTQITTSYLVRVTVPQFTEPFATDISTRPAVWSTSIAGPGAFANAPSGELRVGTTSATFTTITAKASMVATCSLDAAAAGGVAFQWTSITNRSNGLAEVWLVDGSGNGFGIQTMNGASFSAQSVTIAANVASSAVGFLAVGTIDVPMWFRFRKSGTSYAIDYSTNGTTYTQWATGTLASANNPVTSAMRLVVIGHENGSATEARFDNISWADGSAPVGPADPYVPTGPTGPAWLLARFNRAQRY